MLITRGDFIDVWSKLKQRGKGFLISKLNPSKINRTKSAFNESAVSSANWWIIPAVQKRWNKMITGVDKMDYEDYLMDKFFASTNALQLLSIGSGVSSHEIKLAKHNQLSKIVCTDLVQSLLEKAAINAKAQGLSNMHFVCGDINNTIPSDEKFDIIFFHASLHHFYDIDTFIKGTVIPRLKPNGHIVINEYVGVNRLQFPKHQIKAVNQSLTLIPYALKKRYKSNVLKKKFYGSGLIRMILADPSECVDADQILPALHKYCTVIEEKAYGGNILMNALKDIAHNFVHESIEVNQTLQMLFDFEDEYLKKNQSDFLFGVYQLKNSCYSQPYKN